MNRKRFLGILSLALLVFAFMFSIMTQSGYCIGDNILRGFGFKAWSKESVEHYTNGFHYTVLFSLVFAILGYAGAQRFLKELYPKLINSLPLIVIILFFSSAQIFTLGYGVFLSFSKGVNAVDYLPSQSNCNYMLNEESGHISYSYKIVLKNYGNDNTNFNMRVQKPSTGDYTMIDVTQINTEGKQIIKEFSLQGGEQKQFDFLLENQDTEHITGSMHRPNITIFNKEASREFKVH